MKILVVGGSGTVGRRLVAALLARGDEVVVTGRSEARLRKTLPGDAACVEWDPASGPPPSAALAGVDSAVNLAGEPLAKGRWTRAKKARIEESRVVTTRNLVAGLAAAEPKPKVLVSASAIGYYGDRRHNWVHEGSPCRSGDFLAELCAAWEHEAVAARAPGIRTAIVRLGLVLAREGGAYPEIRRPFAMFAGAQIGLGKSWMSWVHIEDVVGIFLRCLDDERAIDVYNATAPNPVSNQEFSKTLGEVMKRPVPFIVPGLMLRLLKGEFARVITTSTRARPLRTLALGYHFRFPDLAGALRDLEGA